MPPRPKTRARATPEAAAGRTRRGKPAALAPRHVLFDTTFGRAGVAFGADGLLAIAWPSQADASTERALAAAVKRRTGLASERIDDPPEDVRRAMALIAAHLENGATDLRSIKLDVRGLSPFSKRVYEAAREIPIGSVRTYAELGLSAGSPGGARAVGRAMAQNPWGIVVPCHRVVGSEGGLHGFSAPGGIRTKALLLELEGAVIELARAPRGGSRGGTSRAEIAPDRAAGQTALRFDR